MKNRFGTNQRRCVPQNPEDPSVSENLEKLDYEINVNQKYEMENCNMRSTSINKKEFELL